jgi:hypothetical protein
VVAGSARRWRGIAEAGIVTPRVGSPVEHVRVHVRLPSGNEAVSRSRSSSPPRTTPEQFRRQLILDHVAWLWDDLHPAIIPRGSAFDLLWRVREGQPLVIVLDEFQNLALDDEGLAGIASGSNALNATYGRQAPTGAALRAGGERFGGHQARGAGCEWLAALRSARGALAARAVAGVRRRRFSASVELARECYRVRRRRRDAVHWGGHRSRGRSAQERRRAPARSRRTGSAATRYAVAARGGYRRRQRLYRGLWAVAGGAAIHTRIGGATGVKLEHALVRRLDTLVGLHLLGEAPVVEAPSNAPARDRVSDSTLRLHHVFVLPQASLLERSDPLEILDRVVEPRLDAFLGPASERLLAPTYDRVCGSRDLPLVQA